MGKRRYHCKSKIEDSPIKYNIETKCPLGWHTELVTDDDTFEVEFHYVPHNRVDDRPPKERKISFKFERESIRRMISDECLVNHFTICKYAAKAKRVLINIDWSIRRVLAKDFEKLQETTRSTQEMYSVVLDKFANNANYQRSLEGLARFIALDFIFSRLMPSRDGAYEYYEK